MSWQITSLLLVLDSESAGGGVFVEARMGDTRGRRRTRVERKRSEAFIMEKAFLESAPVAVVALGGVYVPA